MFGPSILLLLAAVTLTGPAHAAGPCGTENVLWSASYQRIYVSGDVACTLTELRELLPAEAPLTLVSDRTWLLGAHLSVTDGATLLVEGSDVGGDANELRLLSTGSRYVELRAEWGNLMFRDTRVTSWDEHDDGPDTNPDNGRAYVRVRSYLEGSTPRESRMDVIDSEMGWLGHYAAESYGLVWKVAGESSGIYDLVNVYGDVTGSVIHDNYFGMYTFGAYGMNITGNEVRDNVMYGVDPHDDSDALVVEGNYIHDNGNHGFICSQRCDGLIVRNNISSSNVGTGYMLHRGVTDTIVEDNLAEDNTDAAFALHDSYDNILRNNVGRGNLYGIRFSVGSSDNIVSDNLFEDNGLFGIYMYEGSDPPSINDGRPARNLLIGNEVRGSFTGMRASGGDANELYGNVFSESEEYSVSLLDTPDTVFGANDFGGAPVYLDGRSPAQARDSELIEVEIGAYGSSLAFTDSTGRVFANDLGLRTPVGPRGSTLRITQDSGEGTVAIRALPLMITPSAGRATAEVSSWEPEARAWDLTLGKAGVVRFEVGDVEPWTTWLLSVDGRPARRVVARDDGHLRFGTLLAPGTRTFVLTLAGPADMKPTSHPGF